MNSSSLLLSRLTINGLPRILSRRWYVKEEWKDESIDITSVEETPKYGEFLTEEQEQEILQKRNKSKLNNFDRNKLHGLKPHNQNWDWYHNSVRYKQRMLGRHGIEALDVPAGCVWPIKEEVEDRLEWEKTAYPNSLWESWDLIAQKNKENAEKILKREKEIDAKLMKVSTWQKDLEAKLAKKEAEIRAIKERKDRLVAEVRRAVGFDIDPRDERFKQLLEEKEKEDKKRKKALKKQAHAAKTMERLLTASNSLNLKNKPAEESAKSETS
ncbi:GSCOCG00008314001-RA-CDS [Cotesia congregata]|uniref:Large ribosomal subunit protein mL64 n=1 Tax=Cotesia congregata TaxID=51543 RepID=A0A8J2H0N8_COTCN|nr:GSCOCG00008314001-RA-CDS [Cotesia congregata]CAG5077093.1 Similar to Gadd45gip1: Growth arrest and DNA damage-inducible proteins-interacting protein 1 (Mus musculus) [Cotesia congregata]